MIAVLKNTATREQISSLIAWFEDKGLKVNESKGEYCTVLGLIGDTSTVDIDMLQGLDIIEKVTRVSETFKKANRKFHPEDTIVDINGVKIGGGNFAEHVANAMQNAVCTMQSPHCAHLLAIPNHIKYAAEKCRARHRAPHNNQHLLHLFIHIFSLLANCYQ